MVKKERLEHLRELLHTANHLYQDSVKLYEAAYDYVDRALELLAKEVD